MLNFISFHNATGNVLFDNTEFLVLLVESSAVDTLTVQNLSSLSPIDGVSESSFGPRFPKTIIVQKDPDVLFNTDTINSIETQALNTGNSDLQEIVFKMKSLKGSEDILNINKYFTVCKLDNSKLTFLNFDASGDWVFNITANRFSINYTTAIPNSECAGIVFMNEFDTLFMPIGDDVDNENMLEQIKKRAKLTGRIANDYIVLPMKERSKPLRVSLATKTLDPMNTKEMLKAFEHNKKGGTKVETLCGCLRSLTDRYCKDIDNEVGTKAFIVSMVNTKGEGVNEAPMNIMPIDWVLCRASHFKINHAEVPSDVSQNSLIEITKESQDDFGQMIYANWEAHKRGIAIGYVTGPAFANILKSAETTINA